jgi:hypothetical protein
VRDWKAAERRIARMLGGERVPVSGRGRGYSPDVKHPALSIKVKTRAALPAWIEGAMRQSEAASTVEAPYIRGAAEDPGNRPAPRPEALPGISGPRPTL